MGHRVHRRGGTDSAGGARPGPAGVDRTDGGVTSYALSRADSEPHGIAAHGGALWCALETGSLARIEVPS
ncbi:Virginiamycin B lyase [Streptomyces violaceorubidus]